MVEICIQNNFSLAPQEPPLPEIALFLPALTLLWVAVQQQNGAIVHRILQFWDKKWANLHFTNANNLSYETKKNIILQLAGEKWIKIDRKSALENTQKDIILQFSLEKAMNLHPALYQGTKKVQVADRIWIKLPTEDIANVLNISSEMKRELIKQAALIWTKVNLRTFRSHAIGTIILQPTDQKWIFIGRKVPLLPDETRREVLLQLMV